VAATRASTPDVGELVPESLHNKLRDSGFVDHNDEESG
jgi:hypothetical protein